MPSIQAPLPIRFATTTRGNGKVFILLKTEAEISSWEASSATDSGKPIPAKVHLLDDGAAVLIIPALAVAQKVSVIGRDAEGSVVARADRSISSRGASLKSKANTLLHRPVLAKLRNCDERPSIDELAVYALRIVDKDEDCDILHALIFSANCDRGESSGVDISAIDAEGEDILMGEVVKLGEAVEEYPEYPGVFYRASQYSFPIKKDVPWFCLQASEASGSLTDNFVCIQPHEIPFIRDAWHIPPYGYEGSDPDYESWFMAQRPSEAELAAQEKQQREFELRPTFSIVVPLYHTPIDFFRDMAASVLSQTYPNFELILVNSTPGDSELSEAVSALKEADSRVRVVTLEKNLGITENTNAGIEVATGDFVSFFDHDDILEPDLLYCYVRGINEHPEADLLYCDEDKLMGGHYIEPFYKPDWDPLFLETNNYVCHLLTVRRSLLSELPKPVSDFDGAQDHRMALAAGEKARDVFHARRILYHWRIHSASTAGDGEAKPESFDAGKHAIQEHFDRLGIKAIMDDVPKAPHCFVPTYLPDSLPTVSAIISPGDAGEAELTEASLSKLEWQGLQIVRSDEQDGDGTASTRLARAASKATGEYLVLVRAGSTFPNGFAMEQLIACASRDDVSLACPKTLLPDGTNLDNGLAFHNSAVFRLNRYFYHDFSMDRAITVLPHTVSSGGGYCIAVSREDYDVLGGISEGLEDGLWGIDFCMKATLRGMRIAQHCPAHIIRSLSADDLTLDVERDALRISKERAYLLENYPQVIGMPDRFYKPMLQM